MKKKKPGYSEEGRKGEKNFKKAECIESTK